MTAKYDALKRDADQRWETLTQGNQAWIRVDTAICGESVGAFAVMTAIKDEIQRRKIPAVVSPVGCLGLCYAEPIVDITLPGGGPRILYRNVALEEVPALVEGVLVAGDLSTHIALGTLYGEVVGVPRMADLPQWNLQTRIALRNAGHIDPQDIHQYIANGGYFSLDKAVSAMTGEEVVQEVLASGLRGRGGAFFPTGTKWGFLVGSSDPVKYILCNCEEGDPGAYNDKGILESDPHSVIEGMILAGYATGANKGVIFIRHGHYGPINRVQRALEQAYALGLLGNNILGTDVCFDIEVSLVGDSYVAGEETALMEAIEGKRAMPRSRPPFPAMVGVWGRPSNINNVKTLAYIPEIVKHGGAWFSEFGVNRSKGTAVVCLSGNIVNRGMYEVSMGMTYRQVTNELGGGAKEGTKIKLLQTGGPLNSVFSTELLDTPIDVESMAAAGTVLGSGGIIYGDDSVCAVDITRVLVAFCQFESCGKCFPCRLGMTHLLDVIERIRRVEGNLDDLELMKKVGGAMQAGSLCGHGQLGFTPVQSALDNFWGDFWAHVNGGYCPTESCGKLMAKPTRTRPGPDVYKVISDPYGSLEHKLTLT